MPVPPSIRLPMVRAMGCLKLPPIVLDSTSPPSNSCLKGTRLLSLCKQFILCSLKPKRSTSISSMLLINFVNFGFSEMRAGRPFKFSYINRTIPSPFLPGLIPIGVKSTWFSLTNLAISDWSWVSIVKVDSPGLGCDLLA